MGKVTWSGGGGRSGAELGLQESLDNVFPLGQFPLVSKVCSPRCTRTMDRSGLKIFYKRSYSPGA